MRLPELGTQKGTNEKGVGTEGQRDCFLNLPVLPRILKLFLIFLRIGQGTWKISFRPSSVAKLMSIGRSMAQTQVKCPVYKGLWIICK